MSITLHSKTSTLNDAPITTSQPQRLLTLLRQQIRRNATSSVVPSVISVNIVPAPHSGSIRILALNRPKARNAISRQLLSELSQHVTAIEQEGGKGSTRVLILTSDVDSSFCAGADLKERAGFTKQEYFSNPCSFASE
jgi:methylglutaconyl-CoA hydratase